jgi:sortase (surface protein transpeptidase)
LGVHAAIVAVGISETPGEAGNLAVPWSSDAVGWWGGGPAPGQGGVAVIAGHRVEDWPFWRVPELHDGDTIEVTGTNEQTTHWKVSGMQEEVKADLPASIWTDGGEPRLVLVTCGGTFNYATGHYDNNVIIWAKLANAAAQTVRGLVRFGVAGRRAAG